MTDVVTFKLNESLMYDSLRYYDAFVDGKYAHAWVEELINGTKNTYRAILSTKNTYRAKQHKTMEDAQNAIITHLVTRRMAT